MMDLEIAGESCNLVVQLPVNVRMVAMEGSSDFIQSCFPVPQEKEGFIIYFCNNIVLFPSTRQFFLQAFPF